MNQATINLYPGFVTKSQGRIFWHPSKPKFLVDINSWHTKTMCEITSCVNDPWPFVDGGPNCLMEVI